MDSSSGRSKVDIQGVIEDWAKSYFRRKASKKEKKLFDQDQIQLEIDWRRVKFVHDEAVYEPEPPAPGSGKPSQNVLFNTTFTNKTDGAQTYTFRTERTTRSSCSVVVEQGYTQVTMIKAASHCNVRLCIIRGLLNTESRKYCATSFSCW
jgi:hypothetical protein